MNVWAYYRLTRRARRAGQTVMVLTFDRRPTDTALAALHAAIAQNNNRSPR